MEHNWAQERLADFEEGQLPDTQMRSVLQHLEECSECREALQQWQQTRQAVATWVTPPPSPFFVDRAMARVESLPVRTKRWVPEWLYPELGVAVAATILFVIGYLGVSSHSVSAETVLDSLQPSGSEWMSKLHRPDKSAVEILWEGP